MDKKIFISYKYGEGNRYRDKLISRLGNGNFKYLGETKESQNLSHFNDAAIGSILSNKLFTTHVTVVLITPNVNDSRWIPWEISYSLRLINKAYRNSSRNGVVAVVVPDNNNKYDYIIKKTSKGREINTSRLPRIIRNNMFNSSSTSRHNSWDKEFGSYVSIYQWDEFCNDMNNIINQAYIKAENMTHMYDITTQV